MTLTDEEISEARETLIAAAEQLRDALSTINRYGDEISPDLTTQFDGFAYGEIYDGLKILIAALFPDLDPADVCTAMFEGDRSLREAARTVADENSPMWSYSTTEVREILVERREMQHQLSAGEIPADRIVRDYSGAGDDERVARTWLASTIAECLAALAYRNEPEFPA
jgi:hypothetical protein